MDRDNVAETMIDRSGNDVPATEIKRNEAGETSLKNRHEESGSHPALRPGQTIAHDYVVMDQIGKSGAQAAVYLARREGKQCVVKLYNKGFKPSEELMRSLKNHQCPYVAELLDYGYEKDCYYEIYKYYSNGTLDDKGKCTLSFIKDIVIPDVNEGLHFLHTAGSGGIIHADIKPSNIFVSDDESSVIIGDFGISSYMDKTGKLIDEIKGTPEYSPRMVSFFGKATKTSSYDYGSLGLLLIKLATNHSLFEGMDITEITRAWEDGLKIPPSIDSRLKRLITGLLEEDESKRFGYKEVKKWCEGEYVRVIDQNLYSKEDFASNKGIDPLIFGIFDERVVAVASLKELAAAMKQHWDHAKKQIKRETFFDFIRQFGDELEAKARKCCEIQDADIAIFHLLYVLSPDKNIVYKGVNFGTAKEFVESLDSDLDQDKQKIVQSGLLEYFLKQNEYDNSVVEMTNRIINMENASPKLISQILFYLFNKEKTYVIGERNIDSVDDLIKVIVQTDIEEIEQLTHDSKFLAWLYNIGFQEDILKFLVL